jgi:putative spermidine/putrescine transport system permease protein
MGKRLLASLLLLLPVTLLVALLVVGLTSGIVQSFGYIPEYGLYDVSLEHYAKVFSSKLLLGSIAQSLFVSLTASIVGTVLGVVLSYALVATGRDRGVFFSIIKFPIFFPWMVTGLIVIDFFSGGGIFANLFTAAGLPQAAALIAEVLYSPSCLGIIIAFVWAVVPFICFFVITVMGNISSTLGDAALNLGASPTRAFLNVTLPLCRPVIVNVFLITLVSLFANYEIPLLLGMTMPRGLPVEIYYELANYPISQRPEVMALSMVMLGLSLAMVIVITLLFQRGPARQRRRGFVRPKNSRDECS